MSDTRDELTDIAWLKGLAEEGAKAPIKGASILFAAGLIFGTASVLHWAIAAEILTLAPAAYMAMWGVTALVFLATLVVLIGRLKREGGVETATNRAFGIVWSALGWGLFSLFTSLIVADLARAGRSDLAQWSLIVPSIVMAFYGIGWAVTATMTRSRPLWILALASFAAAPALAVLSGTEWQYLAYAGALFGLMALPGFLIMRSARA
ncbi:hypothetical protein IP78_06135 [Brevundimonas sp. AAP58]|uniref:hypothetical protein n=1 Tax=Brevundimonas sp. AAP58 TaxID=1523422 RepID=UPI0006B990E8|nr:hypothetical protein [Brevundimonas sp. AAP58]KPF81007.1 hypothetical protein IP78_06135 [Brevundimonas sp. AAP58]